MNTAKNLSRMQKLHLDKDELEQNIEFCDNLQGQKKRLLADMSAYEKEDYRVQ